jgi:putative ATPase
MGLIICKIIAKTTQSRFVELSAAVHGIAECKKIFEEAKRELKLLGRRTILFLDEIHRFNRSQQDIFRESMKSQNVSLLMEVVPYVERGDITL